MGNPKMAPCPKCKTADYLAVYKYDSGRQYVECAKPGCSFYRGPGSGSIRGAIKLHNAQCLAGRQAS